MKKTLVLWYLIMSFCSLFAQNEVKKPEKLLGNGLYITPTQLVAPEIMITYEHFLKERTSLLYTLGYKIPVGGVRQMVGGAGWTYQKESMLNPFSNALYFSIAPIRYFSAKREGYWQCELFHRFYWMDKQQLSYDGERLSNNFDGIRSERIHSTGLKLFVGTNAKYRLSDKLFFNFKIYGGLSVRYKTYFYENINSKIYNNNWKLVIVPYETRHLSNWGILPLLSVKIGIAKLK